MRVIFSQRFTTPEPMPWSSSTSSALASASGDTLRMIYKKVEMGIIELKFESDDLQAEAEATDHGGGGGGAKEVGPWGAAKEVRGGVCHVRVGSEWFESVCH